MPRDNRPHLRFAPSPLPPLSTVALTPHPHTTPTPTSAGTTTLPRDIAPNCCTVYRYRYSVRYICTDLLRLLLRYCVAASPAAPAHERETPEGEYADEASSSANTRTATRKAITRDNSSNLISLLSRQLTSSHASDLFAAGIARGTMRKVVSTRHPFYSSPRACI